MTYGRIAYECLARLSGIVHQRDKNNLHRDHFGPMPWERLPQHIRERWEQFARDFIEKLHAEAAHALNEDLRKKGATLEDERMKRT